MHRDKKLGLALGVLLVGIVGAFFFRLDHKKKDRVPQLNNAQALDKQIAEKPGAPYAGEAKDNEAAQPDPNKVPEPPLWQMPDFLADGRNDTPDDWLAQTPTAPDPIQPWPDAPDDAMFAGAVSDERIVAHNVSQTKAVPAPAETHPYVVHRVQSGDTLSALAARYLGSSVRFNEIYVLNRDVLGDPNNLSVGTELKIPRRIEPSQPKSNSLFHNADAQRRIEPQPASATKVTAPNPPAVPGANAKTTGTPDDVPRRFVPASRPPFAPGRRENGPPLSHSPGSGRSLSQVPPSDLPDLD